jgi:DNA (cytosine-5)-methyltransferase 1
MDTVPALSSDSRSRIDFPFDNDLYELPNAVRPDCHPDGHTDPSVYGRLRWEKPAQTITTGFLTPGRGRYIHPVQRPVITSREAARLQSIPDSFRFVVNSHEPARAALTKWISDAVPPILCVACLQALTAAASRRMPVPIEPFAFPRIRPRLQVVDNTRIGNWHAGC